MQTSISAPIGPLLAGCLLFFGCQSEQVSTAPEPGKPPNIVLILVDDMGYTDIGAFGINGLRNTASS
jgi:hypothetical protein